MGSAGYEVEVKLQNKVILRDLSETKAAQSIVSVSLAGQQGSGRFFWRDGPAALSSFEHPDLLFGRAFMSVEPRSRSMPSLNHAQQRNLHNACRHMDGLLKDIEVALDTRKTNSVFPKYIHDVCRRNRKQLNCFLPVSGRNSWQCLQTSQSRSSRPGSRRPTLSIHLSPLSRSLSRNSVRRGWEDTAPFRLPGHLIWSRSWRILWRLRRNCTVMC